MANAGPPSSLPNNAPDWLATGLDHLWFPYTQMQTMAPPLAVVGTEGSRLKLADGRDLTGGMLRQGHRALRVPDEGYGLILVEGHRADRILRCDTP